MKADYEITTTNYINEQTYHLACGYYDKTSFLFKEEEFYVIIHCKGEFSFYTMNGELIEEKQAKKMETGRECYMDVTIEVKDNNILFKLPEYSWIDHYPNCDGESDRYDAKIIGIRDIIHFSKTNV